MTITEEQLLEFLLQADAELLREHHQRVIKYEVDAREAYRRQVEVALYFDISVATEHAALELSVDVSVLSQPRRVLVTAQYEDVGPVTIFMGDGWKRELRAQVKPIFTVSEHVTSRTHEDVTPETRARADLHDRAEETAMERGNRVHREMQEWIEARMAWARAPEVQDAMAHAAKSWAEGFQISLDAIKPLDDALTAEPVALRAWPTPLHDGLTAAECLKRYEANMQSEDVPEWLLTPKQKEAARVAWAAQLRAKVEASDTERTERERCQVIVDDDRWEF